MTYVLYECGCIAGGDLISAHCPMHPNDPIIFEGSRSDCLLKHKEMEENND